ncbi:ABC transporter ATP-binding protein [Aeromicrobium sp. JJY06]|uniref:ABC transporter ATP-binding protein n=1 Tax=Aeromicrobium sp. JJY06 TaxID=3373478 RepID=UPI00376EF63D
MPTTSEFATKTGARIDLRGLTKLYGDAAAVDHIDLNVEPGEFVSLLGPSGSGKTTTLNLIAGFDEVTEGEILVDGKPMMRTPAHKRGVGVVFQHYSLFPHMTVKENIEFPLRQRKIPQAQRDKMIAAVLETVRLEGYGRRYPKELSGGQQQRVALARAVVFSPSVLLMDEPLGALDRKLRDWLHLELKRIHRELGSTFVYVTHDQEEALVLSDRVAVFNNGRIEQVGTGDELYQRPRTLFVGRFIGESTLLRGDLKQHGGGSELNFAGRGLVVDGRLAEGKQGVVLIRPECLRLACSEDDVPSGHNVVDAVVKETIFLGPARRYSVEFADGSGGMVRMATASSLDVEHGDRVVAHWAPSDGVLLEDDVEAERTMT